MSDTKICPFCAEEIKAAAIKCRYCQSDLSEGPPATTATTATTASRPEAEHAAPAPAGPTTARVETTGLDEPTARAPQRIPSGLLVGLSLLALMLAAGVGFLAWDLSSMNDDAEARLTGRDAARNHVEKVLSYDHASFDEGTAAAQRVMTARFRREYDDTVALVQEEAATKKSVVRAEVVATSVVSATAERVEALLFVDQVTEGADLKDPRIDRNRVVVTLVPDGDGGWLVDDLDAL